MKTLPRIHWHRFLVLVTAAGLLTLLTVAMVMMPAFSSRSVFVSIGKRMLEGYSDVENPCQTQRQVSVLKADTLPPRPLSVMQQSRPVMIRHPKGTDLEPKPFQYKEVTHDTNSTLVRRPPHCLLLGFAKCGTSALLQFLSQHPKIVTLDWEPDYFCDRMYPKYDLKWYVQRMPPSSPQQITVEKSPCYIVEHHAHIRMRAMNSSLKVMVLVRNPIVRLLSEYGHYSATERYWGRTPTPFIDRISDQKTGHLRSGQLLKVGNYLQHFEHLLQVFPRNQVLVLDGDKLISDPLDEIAKVESFLGLGHDVTSRDIYFDQEKGFYCTLARTTGERQCLGQSKGREHEKLNGTLRSKLEEFFRPYNQKLFDLLGQDFGWSKYGDAIEIDKIENEFNVIEQN